MNPVLLQLCDTDKPGWELITQFDFFESIACTYVDPVGLLTTGMLLFGAVGMSIYIRTGSAVIPVVLMLTTGGVTLSVVAAPALAISTIALLVTGAGAITYLYYRFSR
jgi:hypothetical protein